MARLAKRVLLPAGLLAVLLYGGVCAYMWEAQRQYIFFPSAELRLTPDRKGIRFQEVHIPVGSGAERGELFGWWLSDAVANAPTVLYLHGNGENIGDGGNLDNAARMYRMGYNVLMVDYRGYGKSTGGEPTEQKVYEDADAAWGYLIGQRACPPQRTFIYGHSLGGAVAIELAMRHPEAAGLIAESTVTSMTAMAKLEYGFLPVSLLLNQYFDSVAKIGKLKVPALFIHGMKDRMVPYEMSLRLFERAPQPKYLRLIENGGHGNDGIVGGSVYRDSITAFVRKYAH